MVVEYNIDAFKKIYPDKAEELFKRFPDMKDDKNYIIRAVLNNGNISCLELGYKEDLWRIKKIDYKFGA